MSTAIDTHSTSGVNYWLRAESLFFFLLAVVLYAHTQRGWWLFALLFFVPDLSMSAYAANARVGALAYNAVHNYALPLALGLSSMVIGSSLATAVACVWAAHISFDRMLGYGLKHNSGFQHTHLGGIGKRVSG